MARKTAKQGRRKTTARSVSRTRSKPRRKKAPASRSASAPGRGKKKSVRRRRSQTREEPRFRSYEDDRRGRRGHGDDDRFNQDDARERDEVYTDDPHADDRRHR